MAVVVYDILESLISVLHCDSSFFSQIEVI
jgi:hypothetical protein